MAAAKNFFFDGSPDETKLYKLLCQCLKAAERIFKEVKRPVPVYMREWNGKQFVCTHLITFRHGQEE